MSRFVIQVVLEPKCHWPESGGLIKGVLSPRKEIKSAGLDRPKIWLAPGRSPCLLTLGYPPPPSSHTCTYSASTLRPPAALLSYNQGKCIYYYQEGEQQTEYWCCLRGCGFCQTHTRRRESKSRNRCFFQSIRQLIIWWPPPKPPPHID